MVGAAVRGRLIWLLGEVVSVVEETPRVRSILLDVPGWSGHLPGQHIDIRLTAEDGYQAQRSYSIATPPNGQRLAITVEFVEDGEVSPYLIEELRVGDQLELRGPIGGYFVWEQDLGGPLQLVGGGSGLVPLMAMIRSLVDASVPIPARMLVSARSWDDVIYGKALERLGREQSGLELSFTLTRAQPAGWNGYTRRVDKEMLTESAWQAGDKPLIFVCGPTGFVETVASNLIELGHQPQRVKTERFGPTGG